MKKNDFGSRGFETLSVDPLDEYRGSGIHLRHRTTGAEVYRIDADNPENLFSFAFRTPPANHTGVPHILEHAVLCGSRRYPLKDPFLVLLKGSAHTFLNAMTYPDKTVYPAASTVKADFLNLLRVYGDAVFFPLLKKEAFEQEGHHLEYDDEGRLVRAGVVLNEMKGSYSSAEAVAGDWTLRSLFPDSPYSWDSGGDPLHIPELTWEAFKAFHSAWYHPSNARIFLYGDHDLDQVLDILDTEFLSHFDRREIDSEIPLQPRWSGPRRLDAFWPSSADEPVEGKSTISVNWMLEESTGPGTVLAAQVLSFILLGHSGAPLQKAIIDSGIGEDLSPVSGLETDLRQMVFSAAVRGTDPVREGEFVELVERTLTGLVRDGLDAELVEGALRNVEFHAREIRGGSPFGMRLMKRALRGWLHGRPPRESLEFDGPMVELRSRVSPGYFESIIRCDLLENPHRSTVVVAPDPTMQKRVEQAERILLDGLREKLDAGIEAEGLTAAGLAESLEMLNRFQDEPDSPEDLGRIPFLSRSDLPREVLHLPLREGRRHGVSWFSHESFANGVVYLDMAFDLTGIDPDLQVWMPLFGMALADVGLPGLGYDEVAREIAMKTGGLNCSLEASPVHPGAGGGIRLDLFVHLKALVHQWDEALDITRRLLLSADFDNPDRVRDLLLELRNDCRSGVVPSGNAYASLRASTRHSPASPWEDLWYGVDQLLFLQRITGEPDSVDRACRAMKTIRDRLFVRDRLSLVVTADAKNLDGVLDASLRMTENLGIGRRDTGGEPELFRHRTTGESLSAPSAVSFSALCLPAPILGEPGHSDSGLLAHILRTGYLWENIRMKGGAYGAGASISALEGTFTFTTYRDPAIVSSLESFRASLEWAAATLGDDELNLAVIGAVGRDLRPLSPGERGFVAFKRRLYGITDELRQQWRDELLTATAGRVRAQAASLLESWNDRSITVIAGADALDEAAAACPELAESRIVLPS